jgi:hypothetical protein
MKKAALVLSTIALAGSAMVAPVPVGTRVGDLVAAAVVGGLTSTAYTYGYGPGYRYYGSNYAYGPGYFGYGPTYAYWCACAPARWLPNR